MREPTDARGATAGPLGVGKGRGPRLALAVSLAVALAVALAVSGCRGAPAASKTESVERTVSEAEAQRLYDRGRPAKAAAMLRSLVAKDPKDLALRRKLALAEAAAGEGAAAIEQLRAVVRSDPKDHESLFRLAMLERVSGETTSAESDLARAMSLAPDRLSYVEEVAKTRMLLGRPEQAAGLWARLLRERSLTPAQHKSYLVQQGECYLAAGRRDRAITAWEKALRLDASDAALARRLEVPHRP